MSCATGARQPDLWRPMVELGWHPVLRYSPHITFRPVATGCPCTRWGANRARCGWGVLPATRVMLHVSKQKDPWVLLTNTPPAETDADLYACRH